MSVIGVIVDANSAGRFDLFFYEDGILAVRGTYRDAALRGAGGRASAPATGAAPAARGAADPRLSKGRDAALGDHASNHFIARDSVLRLELEKRWHEHSLTITTSEDPAGRTYCWKPAFNDFTRVRSLLEASFGSRVSVDTRLHHRAGALR